jgi:hypothetical protein
MPEAVDNFFLVARYFACDHIGIKPNMVDHSVLFFEIAALIKQPEYGCNHRQPEVTSPRETSRQVRASIGTLRAIVGGAMKLISGRACFNCSHILPEASGLLKMIGQLANVFVCFALGTVRP